MADRHGYDDLAGIDLTELDLEHIDIDLEAAQEHDEHQPEKRQEIQDE